MTPFAGVEPVRNYIDGGWRDSLATESIPVTNPATGDNLAYTPLSSARDVDEAAQVALRAFPAWRRTPVTDRVQFLFRLKVLLEEQFEDISLTITLECGKTLQESRGEMRRAVENVEMACGTPILIQGYHSEDIAVGMDETMVRQPLGVCAIITPFNFPGMIPFWFLPYAIACGNTVIIKPSERVPLTMQKVMALVDAANLPKGVLKSASTSRWPHRWRFFHSAARARVFLEICTARAATRSNFSPRKKSSSSDGQATGCASSREPARTFHELTVDKNEARN